MSKLVQESSVLNGLSDSSEGLLGLRCGSEAMGRGGSEGAI